MSCLAAVRQAPVKALAHITGGGLAENLPRVLPNGCAARLDAMSWTMPPVFSWLRNGGDVAPEEMARTFNCGIGMIAIVAADAVAETTKILRDGGETVYEIGRIATRGNGPAVTIDNLTQAFDSAGI